MKSLPENLEIGPLSPFGTHPVFLHGLYLGCISRAMTREELYVACGYGVFLEDPESQEMTRFRSLEEAALALVEARAKRRYGE